MDNSRKNEMFFDSLLKSALEQYVNETADSYPSDEELRKKYPVSESGLEKLKKAYKLGQRKKFKGVFPIICIASAVISVGLLLSLIPAVSESLGGFFEDLFVAGKSADPPVTDVTNEGGLLYNYDITYIPEGYTQRETSESPNRGYYCYFDDNGRYIYISISLADRTSVSLEKDTFEHERLNINGRECHLAYNKSNNYGTAIIADNGFVIQIDAIAEKTEILKIAEGMLSQDQKNGSRDSLPIILY